ncbi:MAG: toxin-antitoxin system, antitoxin component, Xre family protein [Geobacteraceae bacterium GWC2_58_44]|nr:MAG: toxin-antitoxin system, antitoxin component, Xre family protein [Geobacteraceae bacterium GWC2_58_44]HBG08348.1 toxin-antitoxin system, antitoxin component, Xre family protein [Geobacter sp.]
MNNARITEHEQSLISKIRALPPEKLMEVEDFIDFLRQSGEDRRLRRAAAKLSEDAFQEAWDNPEDAEYDRL